MVNRERATGSLQWAVTVEFKVRRGFADRFFERLTRQAADSLLEAGCSQFDVCIDPSDGHRVFLYEVYANREAFADHLASAHFKDFDAATRAWVDSKTVGQWHLRRGETATISKPGTEEISR